MPVVQSVDLPPLRRMPCCQNHCFRCENRRGGFQFPFIGIWTRRAVLSRRGATPAETPRWISLLRRCTALASCQSTLGGTARDRSMPPEELDIRSFLHGGTEGPVRALNSLRWMSRQGQLNWPLEGTRTTPTTGTRKARKSQAVVVEPPMIAFLEDAIEDHYRLNNSNCTDFWGVGWLGKVV